MDLLTSMYLDRAGPASLTSTLSRYAGGPYRSGTFWRRFSGQGKIGCFCSLNGGVSMNETDNFVFGSDGPMPCLGGVRAIDSSSVLVNWTEGVRAGRTEAINLLPLIDNFKLYEPLRRNEAMFSTVHVIEDGNAIAWGHNGEIDMAATSIERLAEEAMSADDFSAFLERNKLTHQGAASALGRSRRQIEYYLSKGVIPRIIALACFGYEARKNQENKRGDE
jgi:hypothetical protein